MATLYKLTDENGKTRPGEYNETQWEKGIEHSAKGAPEQNLCSNGWIHAYESPLLAVLFNPIHANFENPILWEAEGEIGKTDGGLKCGVRQLKVLQKIQLPKITTQQRVAFSILVVYELIERKILPSIPIWEEWSKDWLAGKNRAARAADAARAAAQPINFLAIAQKAIAEF